MSPRSPANAFGASWVYASHIHYKQRAWLVFDSSPYSAIMERMDAPHDDRPSDAFSTLIQLRVFLCHSSEDKPKVRDLYHRLKTSGVKPWLDDFDLLPGQDWDREIGNAVRGSDVVLICMSGTSVAKTGYIQREIKYALDVADRQPEGAIFLIPTRLENCDLPERLCRWHWVNLFDEDGYERLIVSLTNRARVLERLPPTRKPATDEWLTSVFSSLSPKFTFDSFVVGASNQFAHAAAKSVVSNPGRSYNPLFIYGGVGTGKTHLLNAVGHELTQRLGPTRVIYTTSERFANEMVSSIRADRMHYFRQKYHDADALLFDDVQMIGSKERTQEEFFHAFNDLHDHQKQIAVTSDAPPNEIPGLVERLRSRFQSGLIADIQPPDLETKMAILVKNAESGGILLPDDVITFVASKIKNNVRELEGTLKKLKAYSLLTGAPINLQMSHQVLRNLVTVQDGRVTIDAIQKAVAEQFQIRQSLLKEKIDFQKAVYPRKVAMYLAKELTNSSLPEIGRAFGGKHHTTVTHAIQSIEQLRQTDGDLNRLLHSLMDLLL